jgi:hypothetical protein
LYLACYKQSCNPDTSIASVCQQGSQVPHGRLARSLSLVQYEVISIRFVNSLFVSCCTIIVVPPQAVRIAAFYYRAHTNKTSKFSKDVRDFINKSPYTQPAILK